MRVGGAVSDPVCPGRGIVAGCAFATAELSLSHHAGAFPCTQVAMFVHDLGFLCCGDERQARTVVVASSNSLATSVALSFGAPASGIGCFARDLSIDVSSANDVAGAQYARLPRVKRKMFRISRCSKGHTQKQSKSLCVASVANSLLYAVGVIGIAPAHHKHIRSRAASVWWLDALGRLRNGAPRQTGGRTSVPVRR